MWTLPKRNTSCWLQLQEEGQREAQEGCRRPELRCGSGHGRQGGLESGFSVRLAGFRVAGGEESEGEERGLGFRVRRASWGLPVLEWLSGWSPCGAVPSTWVCRKQLNVWV